jgi:hypothetical protein
MAKTPAKCAWPAGMIRITANRQVNGNTAPKPQIELKRRLISCI